MQWIDDLNPKTWKSPQNFPDYQQLFDHFQISISNKKPSYRTSWGVELFKNFRFFLSNLIQKFEKSLIYISFNTEKKSRWEARIFEYARNWKKQSSGLRLALFELGLCEEHGELRAASPHLHSTSLLSQLIQPSNMFIF